MLGGIIFAAWDRRVDGFAGGVVNESEGCSGISDGGVAGTFDCLASHDGRSAIKHPKALGIVHWGVVWGLAAKGFVIDVAEGVEGFTLVGITRVFDGAEIGREELGSFGDVGLGDHVLNGSLHRCWSDSIDRAPGETEEAVASVLLKLGREAFGQLDGLLLDDKAADVDDVCSHCARGRGAISVGNLPR